MSVTRVVIGTSNWRDYSFTAPLACLLWREVAGYEPFLFVVGSNADWETPKRNKAVMSYLQGWGIEHVRVRAAEGYETHVTAQNVRQHAAAYPFPEDAWLMLSDADLWPLKRDFYWQHDGFPGRFVLYYANGDHYQSFPTCHMTARAKHWRELMGLVPDGDAVGQMKRNLDGYLKPKISGLGPSDAGWKSWMNDQWMFTEWIKAKPWFPQEVKMIERVGHSPLDRLDRGAWPESYEVRNYTDCHVLRPADQSPNWERLRPILAVLLPDRLREIDDFRDAFVKGY